MALIVISAFGIVSETYSNLKDGIAIIINNITGITVHNISIVVLCVVVEAT